MQTTAFKLHIKVDFSQLSPDYQTTPQRKPGKTANFLKQSFQLKSENHFVFNQKFQKQQWKASFCNFSVVHLHNVLATQSKWNRFQLTAKSFFSSNTMMSRTWNNEIVKAILRKWSVIALIPIVEKEENSIAGAGAGKLLRL